MASMMPRITFRVEAISEPFDGMTKVEIKLGVIFRLGGTEVTSVLRKVVPAHQASMLEVGDIWDGQFIKRDTAKAL